MKLIKATALDKILGLRNNFVSDYCYRHSATGVMKISGVNYFYAPTAKKLACKLAIKSKKPLEQILKEIDDYVP